MAGLIISGAIVLLLVVLGIILSRGKGGCLIAGYNTMPPEEKAKYDEKALCRFMGKTMFFIAFCLVLITVGAAKNLSWLSEVGGFLTLIAAVFAVFWTNSGNRYRK